MPQRKRKLSRHLTVFAGCEGRSEVGYVRWLGLLARDSGKRISFTPKPLGGGDPLGLVNSFVRELRHKSRLGASFDSKALFLDYDLVGENHDNDHKAYSLAERNGIRLIWQAPCHEAFLVRHFEGYPRYHPDYSEQAEREILRVWPNYKKGLSGIDYFDVMGEEHLKRARKTSADMDKFLAAIGWK